MGSSLWIGTTGLNASAKSLDVIGNNIANSNTLGYKGANTFFASMLNQSLGASSLQVGQGVKVANISTEFEQGSFETTGTSTDVAIDGTGFFITKDKSGATYYTRAGAFHIDKDGFLVDMSGYKMQGHTIDATTGEAAALSDLQLANVQSSPKTSTNFTMAVNLDASTATGGAYSTSQVVYDTLGAAHTLTVTFTKAAANGTWGYGATLDGTAMTAAGPANITFNGSGANTTAANVVLTPGAALPNGATLGAGSISWLITGAGAQPMTQYSSTSVTKLLTTDGYPSGVLRGVNIEKDGSITGNFTNGQTRSMARVMLAGFADQGQLTKSGNYFSQSFLSGDPTINKPEVSGLGSLLGGSIETSNVDLSREFINMISAQRAYQANAKTITTADEMLTELMAIKR